MKSPFTIRKLIAIAILVALSFLVIEAARAETKPPVKVQSVASCVNKETLKTIGVGAAYGAGILFVASTIGSASAAPSLAVGAAWVAADTTIGALIGAGAAATANLYTEIKTGGSPFKVYCMTAYAKSQVENALNSGKELLDKGSQALKNAL